MVRAFRSELTKLSRWSVLAGGGAIIVVTVLFDYLQFVQVLSRNSASPPSPLARTLPTTQGLITLVNSAGLLVTAIVIILVTANIAAEWSQGTLRNLLVREPGRLRLLAGKMLALLLFVVVSTALALLISAGVILATAQAQGLSTAAWLTSQGVNDFFSFLGNVLLGIVGVSLLGMLIAVVARSAATAVGISLAYVLVAESLIGAVWPDGAQWLPVHLFGYLPGVSSHMGFGPPPMGYTPDLIVALVWMAGFIVVSAAAFRLLDVSA
jgi:ABC-2 type transport system permease protein